MEHDHYRLLGVDPKASAREIKRAWLKIARREHPDLNPGDREAAARYARLQEAYRVLSQRTLREEYDRRGRTPAPAQPEAAKARPARPGPSRWEQVVRELFPEAAVEPAAAPARGEDVHQVLELTFEQALRGAALESRYQREGVCPDCRGRRWAPGAAVESCRSCGGRGVVEVPHGPWTVRRICPACDGEGETGTPRCRACRGRGRLPLAERRADPRPRGERLGGQDRRPRRRPARPARRRRPATSSSRCKVHAHPLLERRGRNLHATVPVPLARAILGGPVHVPTAEGRSTLRLPPGTQCGQQFTLRGKGVPAPEGGRGDLLVTVSVAIPSGDEPRVRRAAQELERAADEPAREGR